ncbi:MAG TPA: DoxX family membrane protein [Flavobacteriaceae bacterium]|nr:hypothetical protein [Flavobacteriaceae bacterium]MCB9212583.1 hypothetical protein [Alteromonas sp.]HPF10651.1 DoxX family membrane protein [Flavobacteriaceae bacterium]HQU20933.1 DoxX family membrane protein [Flavobacteriaceae bacterium]HQU64417.1 DoxX family membrane protein [Flavobacteriaceae bacterium]
MEKSRPTYRFLRILLGLFLIAYALNKFFHFIPNSYGSMPQTAQDFLDAVVMYLPILYIFEIVLGLFLVLNKWKTFIYIVLFPLSIAFLMFSIINGDMVELWPALLVAVINIILILSRKEKYKVLFD